jgi:glycosyltransferase involved in cell wall biosynthesis
MKVIWAHNFDPKMQNSGVFMHTLMQGVVDLGLKPQLVYLGNLRSAHGIPRASRILRRLANDCDILHAQFGSACGLAVSMVPGRKVVSLRGSDWYRISGEGPFKDRIHGMLATRMTRLSLKRFDRVVVMSNRMRREIEQTFGHDGVAVIPDGIDLDQFQPADRREARRQLGLPDNSDPLVLFPTLLSANPIKRPALAEQAVEFARKLVPNLQFRYATGFPHSSMPLLMNAASVVLMTSVHEGWPNTIKEALACNTPFVSTDVSDLGDIAKTEPSCIVEAPDAELLGAALVRAIRAPRSETLRNHVMAMENRRSAAELLGVYRSMLDSVDR